MALTATSSSELVAGSSRTGEKMAGAIRQVKVLRAFYEGQKIHPVDAVVELPVLLAKEMIAAHKAEALQAAPPTETKEKAKPAKGEKDAG